MTDRRVRPDWPGYLDRFHSERPGITEDLLTRCRDDTGQDPYQWLAEGIPTAGPTLDLACGSGPAHALVGSNWIGLDRSQGELHRAVSNGARRVVRADSQALPISDGGADAVLCSMALMLFDPLPGALEEIRRVLSPGGTVHIMVPTRRPLTVRDTWRYLRLYLALRSPARFPPSPLRRRPARAVQEAGFDVVSDEQRRFGYPLDGDDAARQFVDALYLPGVPATSLERGVGAADRWTGSDIGIALHRIVARRR